MYKSRAYTKTETELKVTVEPAPLPPVEEPTTGETETTQQGLQ